MILPEFAKIDPAEAAALLREHAEIRTSLSQLGIGVDLHCTNLEVVEDFLRRLGAHAQREDALMYRWARKHLREGVPAATGPKRVGGMRKLLRTR